MSPPAWIESLVDAVSACIEPHSFIGPLGFSYRSEDDVWEIAVYPCPVELVGGDVDGEIVLPEFSMDLEPLRSVFEEVADLYWYAHSYEPEDFGGACIGVEGRYQGHDVWLRVLSEPPEDEEPAAKVDVTGADTKGPTRMH